MLTLVSVCMASQRDFTIKVYNADRDFNGVFIYTIVQDDDGFLWVGGDDGLYRFDGNQMLNLNKGDSTIDNLVTASVISADGHVYMGYYAGGISIVEHGRYRKILQKEELPNKVTKLHAQKDNSIWGLTNNRGLVHIVNDNVTHYEFDEFIGYDFVVIDEDILVATNDGLLLLGYDGEDIIWKGLLESTEGLGLNSLLQDDHQPDLIWVGTDDGLFTYHVGDEELTPLEHFPEHMQVSSMSKDQLNTLWVGTKNHGLIEVDLKGVEVDALTYFNKRSGFESNQIGEVYVDTENEVWVGTFGRGLVQLNRAYFHHYELFNTINVQGVHAVANWAEDELMLATESGLVHAYHRELNDSLIFEKLEYTNKYSFTCLQIDGEYAWAGTKNFGVLKINVATQEVIPVEISPQDLVIQNMIRDIKIAPNGDIWVSAAGNGVYHLSSTGELIEHFNTRSGFYHNEISTIHPDNAGNVWFGSNATGLALLTKDGKMRYLSKDEIFPSFDVNTISQDLKGDLWITTQGAGIYRFDGETFQQFQEKDGLLSNYCNASFVDNIGQIWVGHRLGISLIHPDYELIRTFHHPGELGETEAETNSVCRDTHGNIFFGNPFGITKVNLPHVNFKIAKRHTHIKDIRLFYQSEDLLAYTDRSKLDDMLPSDLDFPYDQNHMTFDFVSINLRNPQAIFYQYKLEGFDKDWSPVEKSDHATYTNLDPGTYTFKVRESDHQELWDDEYAAITFEVSHPYWERWWFYLLQVVIIFTVMSLTYFLSSKVKNLFLIRLMVYVSVFIAFEYVHTEMEPFLNEVSGETPIFQVGINLVLALILLPIEIRVTKYLKARRIAMEERKAALAVPKLEFV
ncbi:MAG: hypothetical protein JXR10_12255 [Cyclobacteriaceae bacterium]